MVIWALRNSAARLFSPSATVFGRRLQRGEFARNVLHGSGFFATPEAFVDYAFEIDAGATLFLEAASQYLATGVNVGRCDPRFAPWRLTKGPEFVHAALVANGLVPINGSNSWEIPIANAGEYVLRMQIMSDGSGAPGTGGAMTTVYNWGIDSLPGTIFSPFLTYFLQPDGFLFDFITSRLIHFYDPEIATGYDYSTTGTPFASVMIPDILPSGDSAFELLVGSDVFAINAGEVFDFTDLSPGGVSSFGIRGIDVAEQLDPDDPTAFVTGLSFVEEGQVSSFLMTPVTTNVPGASPVPEPSSLTLLGLGLCGMLGYRVRSRMRRVP